MAGNIRSKQIGAAPGVSVRVSHYAPGAVMRTHAHAAHQVSLVLAGELEERSGSDCRDLSGPSLGYKASGRDHANRYGPNGALILSINLDSYDAVAPAASGWRWRPAGADEIRLARAMTAAGGTRDLLDFAADLAAGMDEFDEDRDVRRPGSHPDWVLRLRDQLREETEPVDLDAAARSAGVHRAHLSRGFRRCFGMPPSLYALRCRLARGVRYLADGAPGSHAAHDAGFADQSHFIRMLKRETGFTPEILRGLLAAG
ncbi:AraC family transcriptional regulator [Hyphobacterium marinum]|uniref:AraC family transcriptional regulator n=1 Tax=Hyphobacterium marinum TaxID=3116574 RepID=A0ABU7LXU1_9PROT|nr:AraC family transcriptional regulator [Hyphobacterium sp. Y6023]MEE2566384.1 AraC family transcriptional regulator [Hyphobacterium sp. Y6023]